MTNIIGNGLKKPLNMLESPIYPDIRKGPPIFKNSGKFWTVDTGRTMTETSNIPQFIESSVLVQSRDYNSQYAYGKSSFKDAVNLEFRPPLITQEDILPLSRLPREIVVPNINPGTAHESGTNAYMAQNNNPSEIVSKLTDRIKDHGWMPTFYAPLDMPQDNQILPDLEAKVPSYSVSAGFDFPKVFAPPEQRVESNYSKLGPILDSGSTTQLVIDYPASLSDLELYPNRPDVYADSGKTMHNISNLDVIDYDMEHNRPLTYASSGMESGYTSGISPVEHDLYFKQPQINTTSGYNPSYTSGIIDQSPVLYETLPHVSIDSGKNMPYYSNIPQTDLDLEEKLFINPTIINPENRYRVNNNSIQSMKISNSRPTARYEIPQGVKFQERNCLSHKPHYRVKQKALNGYRGDMAKGYIPKIGIN